MGQIPSGAWMFAPCWFCVLSGTGLCIGLIIRPEDSYRVWCIRRMWLRNQVSRGHDPEKSQSATGRNNWLLNTLITLIITADLHLISLFVIVNLRTIFRPKFIDKLIMWPHQMSCAYMHWSIRHWHETCDPHFHIILLAPELFF